ncbi:MAG: DUF2007 domain-containing protein [Hyphomicrobiales bacterium]|nr:DUF2007 domain-containing protein [Hyphomicrobiales bacterium]
MKELVRTNDLVLITLIEALLKEQSIDYIVLDQNMSVLEGSIGILPRRIMVVNDDFERARRILIDAEIGTELEQ